MMVQQYPKGLKLRIRGARNGTLAAKFKYTGLESEGHSVITDWKSKNRELSVLPQIDHGWEGDEEK